MKVKLILFSLMISVGFFPGKPLSAQTEMRSVDMGSIRLITTTGVYDEYSKKYGRLMDGISWMTRYLENPAVFGKQEFWVVESDEQFHSLLEDIFSMKDREQIERIGKAGAYRENYRMALRLDGKVDVDWFLRLILTEYARSLLETYYGPHQQRLLWLQSAYSSYLAWMALGELDGIQRQEYEEDMKNYYALHFQPDRAMGLMELNNAERYHRALEMDPYQYHAQGVLTFIFLAGTAGPDVGKRLFRLYSKGESLGEAFRRITGQDLPQLDETLRTTFYPAVVGLPVKLPGEKPQ